MNNFTDTLRAHDLKATPQRLAILDIVSTYGHITIEKLYEKIKNRFRSISLATIYKNINAMKDSMILFEVKLPNEKSVFEIVKDQHSHLLCKNCGNVHDVKFDIKDIETNISKQHNFNIEQTDLVFTGICCNCSK